MKILFRLIILLNVLTAHAQKNYLLVGTYTSGKSEGIYVYTFNTQTGAVEYKSKIKASNPSYITVSPNQQYVYAAFEALIIPASSDQKMSAPSYFLQFE